MPEMGEPAFFGVLDRPVNEFNLTINRVLAVVYLNFCPCKACDIAVFEKNGTLGVIEDRGHVRGSKIFTVADTDDERACIPRGDNPLLFGRDDQQRYSSLRSGGQQLRYRSLKGTGAPVR